MRLAMVAVAAALRACSPKRGPLPRWLRERMLAQGYDPEDKQSRENFKAEHLRWVEI